MGDVWLIRHAESEANFGLPTADPATITLTGRGHEQAEYLAHALPGPPALVVMSPFLRASQTAQPTIARFPDAPQEVWPVEEFTYLAQFRGRLTTTEERRQAVEAYWQRSDPFYQDGEGAESFAHFVQRVQQTLERLRTDEQGFVVVFSHEFFIRAAYWSLLSTSFAVTPERMRGFHQLRVWLRIANAAVTRIRFEAQEEPWLSPVTTAHLPAHLVT
jgi:broad specificity phosphatase PhoE